MRSTGNLESKGTQKADPVKQIERKRVYQVWEGSNRFLLGGRLIFGPDVRYLLLTVILIVVPVGIFFEYMARDLLDKLPERLGAILITVAGALIVFVLLLLLLTSGRDPGIIPRNKHPPEPEEDFDMTNFQADYMGALRFASHA